MTRKVIISLVLVLMLLVGVDYLNAWTVPTQAPPGGNVAAPINTSATFQQKSGNFAGNILAALTEVRSNRYCDALGNNCISIPRCQPGQTLVADASSNWVCSGATVTPTSSAPTLTFTVAPTSVTTGGSATLTWSSTNATACTASGAWSGAKSTTGTQSTGVQNTAGAQTFSLSCTGSGGSVQKSVTVNVTATPQIVRSFYTQFSGLLNDKYFRAWYGPGAALPAVQKYYNDKGWWLYNNPTASTATLNKICSYLMVNGKYQAGGLVTADYGSDNNNTYYLWNGSSWVSGVYGYWGAIDVVQTNCIGDSVSQHGAFWLTSNHANLTCGTGSWGGRNGNLWIPPPSWASAGYRCNPFPVVP